jgi:hypothetical protein
VRPEGLGKFKNSSHWVSNPRPSSLLHSALTTTLPRARIPSFGQEIFNISLGNITELNNPVVVRPGICIYCPRFKLKKKMKYDFSRNFLFTAYSKKINKVRSFSSSCKIHSQRYMNHTNQLPNFCVDRISSLMLQCDKTELTKSACFLFI